MLIEYKASIIKHCCGSMEKFADEWAVSIDDEGIIMLFFKPEEGHDCFFKFCPFCGERMTFHVERQREVNE